MSARENFENPNREPVREDQTAAGNLAAEAYSPDFFTSQMHRPDYTNQVKKEAEQYADNNSQSPGLDSLGKLNIGDIWNQMNIPLNRMPGRLSEEELRNVTKHLGRRVSPFPTINPSN